MDWPSIIGAATVVAVSAFAVWAGHTMGHDEGFVRGWEHGYRQRGIDDRYWAEVVTAITSVTPAEPDRPYDWAQEEQYTPGSPAYDAWFE